MAELNYRSYISKRLNLTSYRSLYKWSKMDCGECTILWRYAASLDLGKRIHLASVKESYNVSAVVGKFRERVYHCPGYDSSFKHDLQVLGPTSRQPILLTTREFRLKAEGSSPPSWLVENPVLDY